MALREKNKKLKPPSYRPCWSPAAATPSVFRLKDRRFLLSGKKTSQHLKATGNAVLLSGVNEIRISEKDRGGFGREEVQRTWHDR